MTARWVVGALICDARTGCTYTTAPMMERLGMSYAGELALPGLVEGMDGVHDDAPFALYALRSAA